MVRRAKLDRIDRILGVCISPSSQKPVKPCQIGRHHPQEHIARAGHQVAFHHLVEPSERSFKRSDRIARLFFQLDEDKDIERQAEPVLIDPGRVAGDHAGLFQPGNPARQRRGGQPDLVGQVCQFLTSVTLQGGDYLAINFVHFLQHFRDL